jgi:hypothetical protein
MFAENPASPSYDRPEIGPRAADQTGWFTLNPMRFVMNRENECRLIPAVFSFTPTE